MTINKTIKLTGTGTAADPFDLTFRPISKWGGQYGFIFPEEVAKDLVGKVATVRGADGETFVKVIRGFFSSIVRDAEGNPIEDANGDVKKTVWKGRQGTDQGKRFVVLGTKKETEEAMTKTTTEAPKKGGTVYRNDAPKTTKKTTTEAPKTTTETTTEGSGLGGQFDAPAVPHSLGVREAAAMLKDLGYSAAEVIAALKEQGLIK